MLVYVKNAILSLKIPGLDADAFGLPNVAYDASGRDLFVELFLQNIRSETRTELETVTTALCGVAISVPFDEGTGRVDRIAEVVLDAFSPRNPRQKQGFSYKKPIYDPTYINIKKVACAILDASLSDSVVVDGRYKVCLFLKIRKSERFVYVRRD